MGINNYFMRTLNSFEYTEKHLPLILKELTSLPQTTNQITQLVKQNSFKKIDNKTVLRLLNLAKDQGKIKSRKICKNNRIVLWNQ